MSRGSFAIVNGNDAPVRRPEVAGSPRGGGPWQLMVTEYFPVEGSTLELKKVALPPGTIVPPHHHDNAEIIYVLDGELLFGSRRCGPGSSVYVASDTRYGFSAGDDGCTFLNFRGALGTSYFPRESAAR